MILVLGSTGFVGSHLLIPLLRDIYPETLRCGVRSRRADTVVRSIGAEPVDVDVRDIDSLNRALSGVRTVINLVTVTSENRPNDFEQSHYKGMSNLVAAARACGVERIIHIGALAGTPHRFDPQKSYLYWKQMATELLRTSGLDFAIFETSIIFGEGDRLISLVALALKYLPVLPIAGVRAAETKFQPIFVKDVVKFVLAAIRRTPCVRRVFPLGGPQAFPFIELIHLVSRVLGTNKKIVMVSESPVRMFCQAGTYITSHWPLPPTFLDLAGVDSIADSTSTYDYFGIQPTAFMDGLSYVRNVGCGDLARWVRRSPCLPRL